MSEVLQAAFKNLVFEVPGKNPVSVRGLWSSNERVVIQGPSGCGKTSLLRVLAGLRNPVSGQWILGSKDMSHVGAHERRCGFVFQGGALFEHLNVLGNLCYGARNFFPGYSSDLIQQQALKFLDKVKLEGFGDRFPATLSGGERQRVALARTLICEPAYLLLDRCRRSMSGSAKPSVIWCFRYLRNAPCRLFW